MAIIFIPFVVFLAIFFKVVWGLRKNKACDRGQTRNVSENALEEDVSGSITFKVVCGGGEQPTIEAGEGHKGCDFRVAESDSDEWEMKLGYEGEPVPIVGSLAIEYVDGAGKYSARKIDLIRLCRYGDGDSVIDAHCRLRNARRSFLVSRIKSAINLDTAEIIDNIDLWLWDGYLNSSHARCSAALEEAVDGASILEFLARVAGNMMKAQRVLISEYVILAAKPAVLLKEDDVPELSEMIRGVVTDIRGYRSKLSKVKGWDEEKKGNLLRFAESLFFSRKVASPMQVAALEELKKVI